MIKYASFSNDCCFAGVPFSEDYKPRGQFTSICEVPVYQIQSLSTVSEGNLLFLPDGFALAQHNIFLADEYARNGYNVYLIDYFEGDGLPIIFMSYTPGTDIDSYDNLTEDEKKIIRSINMPLWLRKHNSGHIWSILQPVVNKLQNELEPSSALFALGHCFGGKYAINLAKNTVKAAVSFHPSFLEPSDLSDIKQPLYIGCAETDVFTPSLIHDLLSDLRNSCDNYKITVFGGTKHGFASRADRSDIVAVQNLKESFQDSLLWFGRFGR